MAPYLREVLKEEIKNWCKENTNPKTGEAYNIYKDGLKIFTTINPRMQEYAEIHPELKNGFVDYFRYGNVNRIIHHVSTGRISPWSIFNCSSGVEFLGSLTQDQVAMMVDWINPDHWNSRFQDSAADVAWARQILEAAGL
jgi:membrane carboxypeptidase/penicillin-binding protein